MLTKERQAWCCLQVKLCDPCLNALRVCVCTKMALYKSSSFPFLLLESISKTASPSVQPLLHSPRQRVLNVYNEPPLVPLKIAHLHRASGQNLIHAFLGPLESTTQMASQLVHRFCTAHFSESLYFTMGCPFPYLIHGSLGPPKSKTKTATRVVQLFLKGSQS